MIENIGELNLNKVYCMDCLEGLKKLPDKSVDLVVTDPPYNIKKDSWDDIKNYEQWMESVFLEIQRVLKDNGSFYFFHSEMEVVADFMNFLKTKTKFIFRQFIVWNKRFDGSPKKGFLDGYVVVENLQNYQQMAEYLLFYTKTNFQEIKDYLREEKKKSKLTLLQINNLFGINISDGIAKRYFGDSQFEIPTKEKYEIMQETGFWQEPYENISHTFNNQKTHHSVWNYDIENKIGHATPKPLDLIKNIILHSSKEGQIVLDCFMGSGTTALACKELNRRYIGFEKDPEYCKIANERLAKLNDGNNGIPPKPKG